jgi:enhancing lycopene biosynthesis protein 2
VKEPTMKTIAVLLSGCGVFDGTEVHEAVLTLLALSRAGVNYQCFAPDIEQMHVVNHLTGEVIVAETRNVLIESARITRGEVLNVTTLDIKLFDGLILPPTVVIALFHLLLKPFCGSLRWRISQ